MSAWHSLARKCKHSIEAFNFSLLSLDEFKTVLIIAALVSFGFSKAFTSSVDIHDVKILESDIASLDHFVGVPRVVPSHAVCSKLGQWAMLEVVHFSFFNYNN